MDTDLESFSRLNFFNNCLMDLGQTAYIRKTPGFIETNSMYASVRKSDLMEPTYVLVNFGIDAGIRSLPKDLRWLGYLGFAYLRFTQVSGNQRLTGKGYPTLSLQIKF